MCLTGHPVNMFLELSDKNFALARETRRGNRLL